MYATPGWPSKLSYKLAWKPPNQEAALLFLAFLFSFWFQHLAEVWPPALLFFSTWHPVMSQVRNCVSLRSMKLIGQDIEPFGYDRTWHTMCVQIFPAKLEIRTTLGQKSAWQHKLTSLAEYSSDIIFFSASSLTATMCSMASSRVAGFCKDRSFHFPVGRQQKECVECNMNELPRAV
jgi:hypothetical protein